MSAIAEAAWFALEVAWMNPAPSLAVSRRARGPIAETWTGIGSRMLMAPTSGFRKRIFRRWSSKVHSSVWPASRPDTTRTYSSMSASFTGRSPRVRRAVKPVEMPKSIRPGASALRVASPLAATGAMRFDGISTPVPRRIFVVCMAAAAIEAKSSAFRSCVS